jgi:hypothetical protein
MAKNVSAADGSFSFDDVWYGRYALQAIYVDQTADLRIVLDENRTSVTMALMIDAHVVTPTPAPATPTPGPHGNATGGNTTITPRPPTPTPPPVTPSYLISSYGVALGAMALICVVILLVMLRLEPK